MQSLHLEICNRLGLSPQAEVRRSNASDGVAVLAGMKQRAVLQGQSQRRCCRMAGAHTDKGEAPSRADGTATTFLHCLNGVFAEKTTKSHQSTPSPQRQRYSRLERQADAFAEVPKAFIKRSA